MQVRRQVQTGERKVRGDKAATEGPGGGLVLRGDEEEEEEEVWFSLTGLLPLRLELLLCSVLHLRGEHRTW